MLPHLLLCVYCLFMQQQTKSTTMTSRMTLHDSYYRCNSQLRLLTMHRLSLVTYKLESTHPLSLLTELSGCSYHAPYLRSSSLASSWLGHTAGHERDNTTPSSSELFYLSVSHVQRQPLPGAHFPPVAHTTVILTHPTGVIYRNFFHR